MDIHDICYLSGILDGEGCISLAIRKRIYVTPTIQVSNTDYRLMEWLHMSLGGNIYHQRETRPTRKQVYHWSIAGAKARDIIRIVRPYLKLKIAQADVILGMEKIERRMIPRNDSNGRFMRLAPEYHEATASALSEIRALNRRGRQ